MTAPSSPVAAPPTNTGTGAGIDPRLTLLLAVSSGLTVANLYYAQPLLETIGRSFGTTEGATGLVITTSQLGYAAGLAFVVPIGDQVSRRRITGWLLGLAAVSLVVASVAPSLWILAATLLLTGLGSVTAQVLVPLAASLADDRERGRVVGTVMTGLLMGILLARTVSGIVADLTNWRVMFAVAAGVTVILAVVLHRRLPETELAEPVPYRKLLRSVARLLVEHHDLRQSALLGALTFAAFSVFWTTIAFHLADSPFDYSEATIGLVGIAGAAGALFASAAGRLADRGWARSARPVMTALLALSFAILWFGQNSIIGILLGILALDIGVQGTQVLNQSIIYELAPEARSRINSAYMTCYFIGASLGSAVGAMAYDAGGWGPTCALGAALAVVSAVASIPGSRGARPVSRSANLPT
ncbi:MAG: MFS transporter [Aquihabitans sp.]